MVASILPMKLSSDGSWSRTRSARLYLTQSIIRFKLILHAEGHYVLIMRMSHAQYDGMSLPLLTQDLDKLLQRSRAKTSTIIRKLHPRLGGQGGRGD